MRVALLHFSPKWRDPARNFSSIIDALQTEEIKNVDLIVLPEAALTGFSLSDAIDIKQDFAKEFAELKKWAKTSNASILFGAFVRTGDQVANAAVHIDSRSGQIDVRYVKNNLFQFAG